MLSQIGIGVPLKRRGCGSLEEPMNITLHLEGEKSICHSELHEFSRLKSSTMLLKHRDEEDWLKEYAHLRSSA
jgi:hypothetical protein